MHKYNRAKFSIAELFNNTDGKTSGSGFIAIILGLVAAISFLTAMVGYFLDKPNTIDVMEQIILLVGAVTALLGARKFSPKSNINNNSTPDSQNNQTEINIINNNDIEKG